MRNYNDRYLSLGAANCALRNARGYTQEQLAQKADISTNLLKSIEAGRAKAGDVLDALFRLYYALSVCAVDLLAFSESNN